MNNSHKETSKQKSTRQFYGALGFASLLLIPATGGLSLFATAALGAYAMGRGEEAGSLKYQIEDHIKENKELISGEGSLEKSVKSVTNFLENTPNEELKYINNIQAYPKVDTFLGIPTSKEYMKVEVNEEC